VWGAALVTVASLFTLVAFHVFAAQSAFTLERLSKERKNEQLRYERLREQVAELSSAQTVSAAATRLGMVPGGTVRTLSVPSGTPAGPTAGATAAGPSVRSASPSYAEAKRALGATP
jgi:hypothetical protein